MEIFSYDFMQRALAMSVCIALLCPCIGLFVVLRKNSMIGDTLSHASLAGVALALSVPVNPLLGAFVFTAVSGVLIEWLRNYFKDFADLILSIVLALSVGIAITVISRGGLNANAQAYLFGSMLTIEWQDLILVFFLTLSSLILLVKQYDALLFTVYDADCAKIALVNVKFISYGFSIMTASAVAVSIQLVGVLVLSSLMTMPVAIALQCKLGFKSTLFLSIVFGQLTVISGLILSYYTDSAPGGMIALCSVIFLFLVIAYKWASRKICYKKSITSIK